MLCQQATCLKFYSSLCFYHVSINHYNLSILKNIIYTDMNLAFWLCPEKDSAHFYRTWVPELGSSQGSVVTCLPPLPGVSPGEGSWQWGLLRLPFEDESNACSARGKAPLPAPCAPDSAAQWDEASPWSSHHTAPGHRACLTQSPA